MIEHDWRGLYGDNWNGQITPDAYAHPAKFARGLIRRIYQHALEQGYLKPGDVVLDPFGGVSLGAIDAISLGLDWVGVELEEKFVKLGQENITLWEHQRRGQKHIDNLPELGVARLLQGDSRYLCAVLGEAGGVVSSPPYAGSVVGSAEYEDRMARLCALPFKELAPRWQREVRKYRRTKKRTSHSQITERSYADNTPGQLGAMQVVSSPPYADGCQHTGGDDPNPEHIEGGKLYGVGISGAVSSPPYAETAIAKNSGGVNLQKQYETYRNQGGGQSFDAFCETQQRHSQDYGQSAGQLGQMRVVSSPPYEGIRQDGGGEYAKEGKGGFGAYTDEPVDYWFTQRDQANIANNRTNDFWQAARQIMQQVAQVLPPGAVAIWVVKGFIRNKEYVDFPDQWRQLGEACGFETLEWIRAWLVEDRGTQYDLFGGKTHNTVQRKSFFRRLAESKGSPPIDFEVVLIQKRIANA